jgi:hypothetical protein
MQSQQTPPGSPHVPTGTPGFWFHPGAISANYPAFISPQNEWTQPYVVIPSPIYAGGHASYMASVPLSLVYRGFPPPMPQGVEYDVRTIESQFEQLALQSQQPAEIPAAASTYKLRA